MQVAPLDSLAHLPGPPAKGNHGAAAIHAGQLLAYASASAVVVVDAQRLAVATTLAGAHRQAAISALAWHPGSGPREPRAAAQLRLASGDEDGRVMVWNVNTGSVIAALEDPWGSAFGTTASAKRPEATSGAYCTPVVGLAWASAAPSVLAVLLAPCILLLWDYRTGGIVWRKDFGGGEAATGLAVDPLDRRRLVLCLAKGTFIVLCLVNPSSDRIRQQQYQVDLGGSGTLRCAFSGTQDLLFLLLQREIIVFDLEYGQPAASTPLPGSRVSLDYLLACYGHAATGKALKEGGIDVLYCSHRDGSISVWQRHAHLLTFSCLGASKLVPPALKFGTAPTLLALSAGLWRGLEAPAPPGSAANATSALIATDGRQHPGMAHRLSAGDVKVGGSSGEVGNLLSGGGSGNTRSTIDSGLEALAEQQARHEAAGRSVLVMGVANDGRVWQWQLPLLSGTLPEAMPATSTLPPAPKPELLGLLHTLPQRVTSFCACPAPVALPGMSGGTAIAVVAAATASGSIEVTTVQQGALLPLHLTVSISLAAHPSAVQGLHWLGCTARLVSYSSEKVAQGYKNTLLLTDVCNRVSMPFRVGVVDPVPLSGLRASLSGRCLLVVFRGAPSEIWAVGCGMQPSRLRQVDLQFAAVEWLPPLPAGVTTDMGPLAASAAAAAAAAIGSGTGGGAATAGYHEGCNPWGASQWAAEQAVGSHAFQPDGEERLAFSMLDGRAGVLGIRGRRISDARPRRPTWQALAAGDFRAVAIGSWAQWVLLGDAEGTLAHWDTGYGRIRKIYTSSPPSEALYPHLPGSTAVQARVAILFASGLFATYDLDLAGELWATHATASAAAARVGRVTDIEWLPLPAPMGCGAVLVASLADGALALFDTVHSIDTRPRRTRMQRYRAALHMPPPPGAPPLWGLLAAAPVAATPLLPRAWGLLLRLLLQRGVPEMAFRELGTLAASIGGSSLLGSIGMDAELALEQLDADIWAHLPRGCQAAWESLLAHRVESGGGNAEMPTFKQLVKDFGAESDNEDSSVAGGLDVAAVAAQRDQLSFDGPAVRDEAAAAALGITRRSSSASGAAAMHGGGVGRKRDQVAQTLKGIRGAVRSQLMSLTAGGGRGQHMLVAAVAGISDGFEYGQQRAGFTSLVEVLHAIATARGQPSVLSPAELAAYEQALGNRRVADRMALAAELAGDECEAAFWRRLPATLTWLVGTLAVPQYRAASAAVASPNQRSFSSGGGGTPLAWSSMDAAPAASPSLPRPGARPSSGSGAGPGDPGNTLASSGRLWDEAVQLRECSERSSWHEQMSRRMFEGSEDLQEKRVLEYVALGDFQTAVGFLLASPPDRTTRYYRDALCTLGMAFACGLQQTALLAGPGGSLGTPQQQQSPGMLPSGSGSMMAGSPAGAMPIAVASAVEDSAARTLFVQAAKVITANAAAVGDTLLGVPLLCSTGQHADATALLQDSGLWRYAATLVAHALRGSERAGAMERWAVHVAEAEGRPWVAAGLLVAAGALKSALALLRQHGLPDAAAALVTACKEAGLPLQQHSMESCELSNLFGGSGQQPVRFDSAGARVPDQCPSSGGGESQAQATGVAAGRQRLGSLTDYKRSEVAEEFHLYACEVLQQL